MADSGLIRPDRDHTLMSVAHTFAHRSTCTRSQVGAVISIEGRILSTGYNGAPAGMPHCDHTCDGYCATAFVGGHHHATCPAARPCTTAIHAEANAIAYAARFGVKILGASMYTTLSPCVPCAQLIINSGIMALYYDREYRDISGLEMLFAAHCVLVGTVRP